MKTKLLAIALLLSAPLANAGMTKADYLTTRTVKSERGQKTTVEVIIYAPKTKDTVLTFDPKKGKPYIVRKTLKAGSGKHTFSFDARRGWYASMSVNGTVTDKETATRKTGRGASRKGLDRGKLGSSRGL